MKIVCSKDRCCMTAFRWFLVTLLAISPHVSGAAAQLLPHIATIRVSGVLVSIYGQKSGSTARLEWNSNRRHHTQQVRLPRKWRLWNDDESRAFYIPPALSWKCGHINLLIIVGDVLSGAYGVRAPLVYRFRKGKWRLVIDPSILAFTNRGGFNLSGKRLRVWDYKMAKNTAHSVPQRYWLKEFAISQGHIVQRENRMTSGSYLGHIDFDSTPPPPRHLSKKDDPLHEFGLRWRWWGDTGQR